MKGVRREKIRPKKYLPKILCNDMAKFGLSSLLALKRVTQKGRIYVAEPKQLGLMGCY